MKYWTVSYILGEGKKIFLVNVFYYFVLFLNVAIPVFAAVAVYGYDNLFPISYQMLIWIQVFTCFVQADGCRRFYAFINKNVPAGINNRAVSMHVGVYLLYLISLVYIYFTFARKVDSVGPHQFTI